MNPVTDRAAMFAQLRAGMAELGLAAEVAAVDALLDYLELLTRWNSAYNLTSIRAPEQMVTHHLLDSLAAAPSSGGAAEGKPSGKPVGTKLVQDASDSPKAFKLSANDGGGHGLGKVSLTVDGRNVWPPDGPGCPELVRCCTALAALDESLALACQLAVGRDPDCPTALRTSVAIAGESSVAPPAACPR